MSDGSDTTSGMSTEDNHNPFADAALDYLRRGWKVIELHRIMPSGECSCGKAACDRSAGKHPRNARWQRGRGLNEHQIREIWKPYNPYFANVGIATGAPSGFWVLDIDPDSGGNETIRKMQEANGPLSAGRVTRTGSGGWHLHFTMPDFDVSNSPGRITKTYGKGVDVRGTGGQIVAPPSVSAKGAYAVIKDEPIGPAPDWLLDLIRPEEREPLPTIEDPSWTASSAVPTVDGTSSATPASNAASAADASSPLAPVAAGSTTTDPRVATYAQRAWDGEIARLHELAQKGWDGPPWDATTYEVACNLLELANAPWTPYGLNDAYAALFTNAPRDEGFDDDRINTKFESARAKVGGAARREPVLTAAPVEAAADPLMGAGNPDVRVDPRLLAAQSPATGESWPMRTWDDLGNAERLVDHYGQVLRWVEEAGKWAHYTGTRWELVPQVRTLVHAMLDSLATTEALSYSDVKDDPDDKASPRTAFMKWVKTQRMSSRISACLKEAAGYRALQATLSDFDANPMLLNVANGVVDLTTGALLPPDPAFMMMQQSPVAYQPDANAPLWDKFLERTQPDAMMRGYLQRVSGYSLTGRTGEQAMFMHHGTGANGKSVFLRAAALVTGDYGQTVHRSTLLVKSGESHPTDIARMVGKRFLQVSETAAGRRLDEEVVKGLTGGEKQTARFMHGDFFDFTPTGKIHYVTNHLPRLSDAESIWRRLHLIGWRVTIPAHEMDPDLGDKLEAEAPGILAWMVRGAVEWHRYRLQPPAEALGDLAEYRREQDEFGEFMATCLIVDPTATSTVDDLYAAYQGWCWRNGVRNLLHGPDFSKVLVERGFERVRNAHVRGFRGLTVNPLSTSGIRVPATDGADPLSPEAPRDARTTGWEGY